MRIPSGVTDQYIYFVAVDATDFTSREQTLSSFTVYRSRDGGAAAAMTTPTINETDTTNMPGVYELLLDEDMTIGSGNDSEEMVFHITHAGMAPVTRTIELYRPKITAGNTLDVTATGAGGIDWGNVENPTTAVDLSGTDIQLCDTVTTNTDMLTAAAVVNEWETQSQADPTGFHVNVLEIGGTAQTPNDNGADINEILVDTNSTLNTHLTDIKGANFSGATDALDAIRAEGDSNWGAGAVTSDSGTAQAGAAGTITLAGTASAANDTYNGHLVYIESGTGLGQARAISDYVGSTKVATVITNWAVTPDNTSVYKVFPDEITEITAAPTANAVAQEVWDLSHTGHTNPGSFGEQAVTDVDAILSKVTTVETQIGTAGDGLTAINLPNQTMDITGNITGNLSGSVGSVTGAVGSVTGAVGSVTGAVGSVTGNVGGSVASVTGAVGSVTGNVGGNVAGSVGSLTGHTVQTGDTFALANGLTGFAAIDTVVDAVKAKTDLMNFGVANQLDCNVESINATAVVGIGTSGNKWRA